MEMADNGALDLMQAFLDRWQAAQERESSWVVAEEQKPVPRMKLREKAVDRVRVLPGDFMPVSTLLRESFPFVNGHRHQ